MSEVLSQIAGWKSLACAQKCGVNPAPHETSESHTGRFQVGGYLRSLTLVLLFLFTAACSPESATDPLEIANRDALIGTWAIETRFGDKFSHREEITLKADGTFDSVTIRKAENTQENYQETGEWSLNGKQFKRRYKTKNGQVLGLKQQSYITLDLNGNVGKTEFEGLNNIRKTVLVFRRI